MMNIFAAKLNSIFFSLLSKYTVMDAYAFNLLSNDFVDDDTFRTFKKLSDVDGSRVRAGCEFCFKKRYFITEVL